MLLKRVASMELARTQTIRRMISIGGDLAPSLRGDVRKFRRPRFLNEVFLGKNFIFAPKISDDLSCNN